MSLTANLLVCVQTEENTVMKEALGRMKDTKEKNMCWQDGRLFEDKEDWVVDSCTKCKCQVIPVHVEQYTFTADVCKLDRLYDLLIPGVQDSVPPNYMPSSGLCQPFFNRWRMLPRLHA